MQGATMNKQWIYRNGEKPFSVTEIVMTDGEVCYVSVTENEGIFIHQPDGKIMIRSCSVYDLIPYEPYGDYEIDDEVYASDKENDQNNLPRHFAGLNGEGKPTTFDGGQTSFTTSIERYVSSWNFCEKANKEDK
jgi:hypothetical protein